MKNERPKLKKLADACMDGACNARALMLDFAKYVTEETHHRTHFLDYPEVAIILGQLNFLVGNGPGPSEEAIAIYREYCDGLDPIEQEVS